MQQPQEATGQGHRQGQVPQGGPRAACRWNREDTISPLDATPISSPWSQTGLGSPSLWLGRVGTASEDTCLRLLFWDPTKISRLPLPSLSAGQWVLGEAAASLTQ